MVWLRRSDGTTTVQQIIKQSSRGQYYIPDLASYTIRSVPMTLARCKQLITNTVLKHCRSENYHYWRDFFTRVRAPAVPDLSRLQPGAVDANNRAAAAAALEQSEEAEERSP